MADITRVKLEQFAKAKEFIFQAGVTGGQKIDFKGEDTKILIIFNNTGSKGKCDFLAGNGIQGVNDISVDVPAGFSAVTVESGAFKQVTGADKGFVKIKPSATTITIAVVELV